MISVLGVKHTTIVSNVQSLFWLMSYSGLTKTVQIGLVAIMRGRVKWNCRSGWVSDFFAPDHTCIWQQRATWQNVVENAWCTVTKLAMSTQQASVYSHRLVENPCLALLPSQLSLVSMWSHLHSALSDLFCVFAFCVLFHHYLPQENLRYLTGLRNFNFLKFNIGLFWLWACFKI